MVSSDLKGERRHYTKCFTRLFIVDGCISLPVAISGFWVLPDLPEITRAWYLTKDVSLQS